METAREKKTPLSESVAEKNALLISMNHELRNPLNVILGFTQTLLMKLPGPVNAEQEKQLKIIVKNAKIILAVVDALSYIGKVDSGRVECVREPVSCLAIIEAVRSLYAKAADMKKLRFEISQEDFTVNTDKKLLQKAIDILVNNAITYTDQGYVKIRMEKGIRQGKKVVCIHVTDSGVGIGAMDQAKLFQPFQQISSKNNADESKGLDLYLCRKIVNILLADMDFESEENKGSRFSIYLTVAD